MMEAISAKYRDAGLLVLRVGIGIMFMFHGGPKLFGGPEKWERVGSAMESIGVGFAPAFWGFMAGFTEFAGGILLIIGLFFQPACIFLAFTMLIAALKHLSAGDGILGASHAIELGIVFISLILIGPGRLAVDRFWGKTNKNLT